MQNFTKHPDYDGLPRPIKEMYSPKEYAWLSDDERANLVQNECLPDWMLDDEG